MIGELADKFALSAAVPFPKGMEGVDFGKIIGETGAELADAEILEIFFGFEFGENALRFWLDGESAAEEIAFGDIYGADFAGPTVNVLKEVGVDFTEVGEIKFAIGGRV